MTPHDPRTCDDCRARLDLRQALGATTDVRLPHLPMRLKCSACEESLTSVATLRAENARLRAALEQAEKALGLATTWQPADRQEVISAQRAARRALRPEEKSL